MQYLYAAYAEICNIYAIFMQYLCKYMDCICNDVIFIFTTQKMLHMQRVAYFTPPLTPGGKGVVRHILHIYNKYAKSEHESI